MELVDQIENGLKKVTLVDVDLFLKAHAHHVFELIYGRVDSTRYQILQGTKFHYFEDGGRIMGHHLKDMVNLGK